MKTLRFFGVITILAMLVVLLPAGVASAGTTKVAVCHLDEYGVFHLINISEMAFPAHVEHGDASPGDWVPGQPGMKFADDCSLISIPKTSYLETMYVVGTQALKSTSANILTSGQQYELKASGTYRFATWGTAGIADAKFSLRTATYNPYGPFTGWVDGADLNADPLLAYGLQVSEFDGDYEKPLLPLGWLGAYNPDHVYYAPYTGKGTPLELFIYDNVYSDNSGGITVEIYIVNW